MKKLAVVLAFVCVAGLAAVAHANSDGCNSAGQKCVCGNTGWQGDCGTGADKAGLYCRCNPPGGQSGCPPKTASYQFNEGPSGNKCANNDQCDGCRYCSTSGWCQGTSR